MLWRRALSGVDLSVAVDVAVDVDVEVDVDASTCSRWWPAMCLVEVVKP